MGNSVAQPLPAAVPATNLRIVSALCAYVTAALFAVSGGWKLLIPFQVAQLFEQLLIPPAVSLPFAVVLGAVELAVAVWLILPSHRRWGALLASVMLVSFMAYMGIFYDRLQGAECSCFPWVKRTVGPAFFISDAVMLLVAALAAVWVVPSHGVKRAGAILLACLALGTASWGVQQALQTGKLAPAAITVDGKPFALREGKVFLYFYDPECAHCDAAARKMAPLAWGDTKVVSIATRVPQFAADFLRDTKLKAGISPDLERLKAEFPFVDGPFGVVLVNGRQQATITSFEQAEPGATLRKHGLIQ